MIDSGEIIIYTCITGDYDTLRQPFQPPEGFRFVCFVRKGTKTSEYAGVWKMEELPSDIDDPTLLARYSKLNPQSVLGEASQWSLWMDGNIRIADGSIYEICRDLVSRDVKYAGIKHPFRNCAYEESVRCLHDRRDTLASLMRTVCFLRRKKLPPNAGMMETGVIFRKHNDPDVIEFDRRWWDCLTKYSHRDQLTHTACLRDTPSLKAEYIFPEGVTVRNHPGLEYFPHPQKKLSRIQRKLKFGPNRIECPILRAYIKLTGILY